MKPYHIISGIIFGLVAIIHLLRVVNQWPVVIGDYAPSMAMSWFWIIFAGGLSIWSFRLITPMHR